MIDFSGLIPRDGGGDLERLEISGSDVRPASQAVAVPVGRVPVVLLLMLVAWWVVVN